MDDEDLINTQEIREEIDSINRAAVGSRYTAVLLRNAKRFIRPLAYASEVGESLRPLVSPIVVNSLYGVSIAYIGGDIGYQCYKSRDHGTKYISYLAFDQTLWHGAASLVLPAVTIHTVVKYTQKYITPSVMKRNVKIGRFTPLIAGLGSIPFIVSPIDHSTDFVMNNTFRKYWYGNIIEIPHH